MESELSGIFWVKLVAKNIIAWVPLDTIHAYENYIEELA